jgi:hypothetical protein
VASATTHLGSCWNFSEHAVWRTRDQLSLVGTQLPLGQKSRFSFSSTPLNAMPCHFWTS